MSFWGRILIALNIVLSFTYLIYAAAVFNVQKNWKEKSQEYQEVITQKDKELTDLNQRYDTLETDRAAQVVQLTDRATKAEATLTQTTTALDTLNKRMETTQTELEREKALSQISGEEARLRNAEALKEREANTALHKKIDELLVKVQEVEDKVYDQRIKENTLIATHESTLNEIAQLKKIIRYKGLDKEETREILAKQEPPPTVEGLVEETKSNSSNGQEFVAVTIGSDDGLVKGHHLYVYRFATSPEERPKYLCKIELVNVTPDSAVGVVVEKSKNGVIKKGDHVSSKL
ncbi:MAG: hypothetical protein ACKVT0_21660 [Planctomycetaceae bacterium]